MNPNPGKRVDGSEMEYYQALLTELVNIKSGLSEWEVDFVESLSHWEGPFTTKQADTLEKLYGRAC